LNWRPTAYKAVALPLSYRGVTATGYRWCVVTRG